MTAKYFAILTNQGAARLANAAALGTKLNLTQMAVGDANGTLPTPDPAQTKLINQKRIAPLNLLTVDPANTSQIIAEQIIPENEGGFWIREIGLYDDDGILIAVANCPETYKPQLQEGSGRTQTIRMILIVSSTSSITLKIDPSVVLATRKYADDKAIELKLYVDDLMSKHLAAADPHSQYATKDSPTFTGKPKAPTPPVVANDTQVATAGFVQAVIAALVSGELANKQPLDKTLTDLSGKDVAAILEYLGLKSAAQRDVGTGTNQIPDMNSFTSGPGWMKFPSGIIIQYGNQISSASGLVAVSFPIPFPTQCFGVTGAGTDVNFANIAGCQIIDKAVFHLSAWVVNAGPTFYRTATNISWIAIGI